MEINTNIAAFFCHKKEPTPPFTPLQTYLFTSLLPASANLSSLFFIYLFHIEIYHLLLLPVFSVFQFCAKVFVPSATNQLMLFEENNRQNG